jgi:hypothetical protein
MLRSGGSADRSIAGRAVSQPPDHKSKSARVTNSQTHPFQFVGFSSLTAIPARRPHHTRPRIITKHHTMIDQNTTAASAATAKRARLRPRPRSTKLSRCGTPLSGGSRRDGADGNSARVGKGREHGSRGVLPECFPPITGLPAAVITKGKYCGRDLTPPSDGEPSELFRDGADFLPDVGGL